MVKNCFHASYGFLAAVQALYGGTDPPSVQAGDAPEIKLYMYAVLNKQLSLK